MVKLFWQINSLFTQSLNRLHGQKTNDLGLKSRMHWKKITNFHRLCLRTMGHRVELFIDILRTSVIKWSSQPSTIAAAFYMSTMFRISKVLPNIMKQFYRKIQQKSVLSSYNFYLPRYTTFLPFLTQKLLFFCRIEIIFH